MGHIKHLALVEVNGPWVGGPESGEVNIPPVGLLYLAAAVRQRFGERYKISVINLNFDFGSDEEFGHWLINKRPDIVGLRGLTPYRTRFVRISSLIKDILPDATILGGGPIAAVEAERLVKEDIVHFAVKGEGELVTPELMQRLEDGSPSADIPGIVFKSRGEVVSTGEPEIIENIDNLPMPDYSMIDVKKYSGAFSYAYNKRRQGVIVGSRGCPFKCTYCHTIHGKVARVRSAKSLLTEMMLLFDNHGISDFYFIEDIFNIDQKRFNQFFEKIIEARGGGFRPRLYFVNGLRGDIISRSQIDLMVEAGTIWVLFAIESASPRLQKYLQKHLDLDKTLDAIEYSISKNIAVNYCSMYGLPTETEDEAMETLRFLSSISKPSVVPMHFELKYYQGSGIVKQAREAGMNEIDLMTLSDSKYHFPQTTSPELPLPKRRGILARFHKERGLKSDEWVKTALTTLRGIGWDDDDILGFFSILKNVKYKDLSGLWPRLNREAKAIGRNVIAGEKV